MDSSVCVGGGSNRGPRWILEAWNEQKRQLDGLWGNNLKETIQVQCRYKSILMIQKGVKILEGQHDHTWGYRLRHDNKHNLIIEMIDDKSFLSIYLLYAISYN